MVGTRREAAPLTVAHPTPLPIFIVEAFVSAAISRTYPVCAMTPAVSPAIHIRRYEHPADYASLRLCFIELQRWERQFEPSLPDPEQVADDYLADMLSRCEATSGQVLLAQCAGAIVGFVCLMTQVPPELDDSLEPYAYISDLVVASDHRERGVGRRLVTEAETLARAAGIKRLKVGVLVANKRTHRFYHGRGFR